LGVNGAHKFSCSSNDGKSNAVAETLADVDGRHYSHFRSKGNVATLYYKGLPSYFDTKLVSHVVGNLYQGGCQNGVTLGDDFVASPFTHGSGTPFPTVLI
jgi:hypothetical protein